MLNHKVFGGFLMGIGVAIFVAYFIILLINEIWALIVAVTILTCIIAVMFFWLGFKIITSTHMRKEGEGSEKV